MMDSKRAEEKLREELVDDMHSCLTEGLSPEEQAALDEWDKKFSAAKEGWLAP